MTLIKRGIAVLATASTLFSGGLAQDPQPKVYNDSLTGISFNTWNIESTAVTGGMTFGMALPSTAMKTDATEFIGYLNCASKNATTNGWCGISLGGSMTESPLILAYPDKKSVKTSLRFATKYTLPPVYTGNATVRHIASAVNSTDFSVIFHCQDCLHWSQNGTTGSASTSGSLLDFGYAQSIKRPINPSCADKAVVGKHENHGTWTAMLDDSAASSSYPKWRAQGNHTLPSHCPSDHGGKNSTRHSVVRHRRAHGLV